MNPAFRDVLLVDDDPGTLVSLSRLLKPAGFRVRTAADGTEALRSVRQECPCFIITDWLMAPMDGIEFCRAVRRENLPHYIYVVLLTVKDQANDTVVGLNAGADDFLTKPVHEGELLARLRAGARVLTLEKRLNRRAQHDPLTGVLNRRSFLEVFGREWARTSRHGGNLSCVMIDVDFFKWANDSFGHLVGDDILAGLARLIAGECRNTDYVCRWGGDEFLVLLPETDESGASNFAERCSLALTNTQFCADAERLTITASFGVAQRYGDMRSPKQLLTVADQALLTAKRTGRNRVATAWNGRLSQPAGIVCSDQYLSVVPQPVTLEKGPCLGGDA
jgi:two-component system, cell cycle response regulator